MPTYDDNGNPVAAPSTTNASTTDAPTGVSYDDAGNPINPANLINPLPQQQPALSPELEATLAHVTPSSYSSQSQSGQPLLDPNDPLRDFFGNLGAGVLKGAGSTLFGLGKIFHHIPGMGLIAKDRTGAFSDSGDPDVTDTLETHGFLQGAGKMAEQVGEAFIPGGVVERGIQATKGLPLASRIGSAMWREAAAQGSVGFVQSGGDPAAALWAGGTAGAFRGLTSIPLFLRDQKLADEMVAEATKYGIPLTKAEQTQSALWRLTESLVRKEAGGYRRLAKFDVARNELLKDIANKTAEAIDPAVMDPRSMGEFVGGTLKQVRAIAGEELGTASDGIIEHFVDRVGPKGGQIRVRAGDLPLDLGSLEPIYKRPGQRTTKAWATIINSDAPESSGRAFPPFELSPASAEPAALRRATIALPSGRQPAGLLTGEIAPPPAELAPRAPETSGLVSRSNDALELSANSAGAESAGAATDAADRIPSGKVRYVSSPLVRTARRILDKTRFDKMTEFLGTSPATDDVSKALKLLQSFTDPVVRNAETGAIEGVKPLDIATAKQLRTVLFDLANSDQTTIGKGAIKQLNSALNDEIVSTLKREGLTEQAQSWQAASARYRQTMDYLEGDLVEKIVKRTDPKAAPETFVKMLQSGETESVAKALREKLTPEQMSRVQAATLKETIEKSMVENGLFNVDKFKKSIDQLGPEAGKTLYGPELYTELQAFAKAAERYRVTRSTVQRAEGVFLPFMSQLTARAGTGAVVGAAVGAASGNTDNLGKSALIGATLASTTLASAALAHMMTSPEVVNNLTRLLKVDPMSTVGKKLTARVAAYAARSMAATKPAEIQAEIRANRQLSPEESAARDEETKRLYPQLATDSVSPPPKQ